MFHHVHLSQMKGNTIIGNAEEETVKERNQELPVRKNQDRMEHQNQGEKMIPPKQLF